MSSLTILLYKAAPRLKFNNALDKVLLIETIAQNPFGKPNEAELWKTVNEDFCNHAKVYVICRTTKERVALLMKQHASEDGLKRKK